MDLSPRVSNLHGLLPVAISPVNVAGQREMVPVDYLEDAPIVCRFPISLHVRSFAFKCQYSLIRAQLARLHPKMGGNRSEPTTPVLLEREVIAQCRTIGHRRPAGHCGLAFTKRPKSAQHELV